MKTSSIIIALLVLNLNAFSQAMISGKVTDKEKNAIENASVYLYKNSNEIAVQKTDASGLYAFKNLKPGTYNLFANADHYQKSLIQSAVLGTNSTLTLHFVLKAETKIVAIEAELKTKKEKSRHISIDAMSFDQPANTAVYGSNSNQRYTGYDYNQIQHNTESYDYIEENNFKTAYDNPLSTFSVDVDRASYSNVRRFIRNNQAPPKDAVRVEEMINYFDYDYPQPENGHPFSINTEMSTCPWNETHELIMIGLKGEEMQDTEIPASNIVFLIDVSGSMQSPNKLPLLKKSFNILVEKLRPEDRVAMVVYAGSAGAVLESTPGDEKLKISEALERLSAGGSTAGGAGIKLAYKIAKENYIPNGNNRVILATDGDFNVGASSDAAMERLIEEKRNDGIFLTILGFGMGNYKDSKMEKLSNKGNGNYAYIDNILEAKKMFADEIWGTLYTIAKDVKFQIEFNPAQVKAYRLVGYENRMLNKEDFNDDKKDAGEIGAGHCVTALYEIIPAGSDEEIGDVDDLIYQQREIKKSKNILTLKLRYKAPDEEKSRLITKNLKKSDVYTTSVSDNFNQAASVAMFGMLLRDSEFKADANYSTTLELAKSARGDDAFGYRQEYITMVESARYLK
ncbi:MAG: von Willebrand factor type A domain-containing protein [Bacteroidota bacterium]|nr:von Willebrand factor type A domain-containing protein [Bacteroidota bacterium]